MKYLTKLALLATGIVLIVGGGSQYIYTKNSLADSLAIAPSNNVNTTKTDSINVGINSEDISSKDISKDVSYKTFVAQTSLPSVNTTKSLPFKLGDNLGQLEMRSQASNPSLDRSRSRYILANTYLSNRRPNEALELLKDLEAAYPIMAEYILLSRSRGLAMLNSQGSEGWNQILKNYPQGFAAAEALVVLGRPAEVLAKFPSHPRSRAILKTELGKNPNQFDLLVHMAVYFNDDSGIIPILNRLVSNHEGKLNSKQWSAIAQGYFEQRDYKKANFAYSKATADADNLYLWGRSLQRANKNPDANSVYNRLVLNFPIHPLAPRAILRMMDIASNKNDLGSVNKLSDRLSSNYANTAAEGLLKKLTLMEKLGNAQAANTRNQILTSYPNSNEAGLLTWRMAQQQAKNRNFKSAIALTQKITTNNPQAEITAEAGYWGGKWAKSLGDSTTAKQAFNSVIVHHPDSYFAWRSAFQLGWQVGDFTTVRNVRLPLVPTEFRQPLPAGSATLQELYLLGQDRDASDRWQFETRGNALKTPSQIFTDGVIRVGANDNLRGLRQIESMYWLDVTDTEKAEIKNILNSSTFSQALYPMPYWEQVSRWSNTTDLSSALVIGLIRQESRFESQIVSSADAVGLMQIIPETAAWIAGKKGVKNYNLRNPDQNVEFGTWYLDYTHREFGNNTMLAIASYNAGPGRVKQWVNSFGVSDPEEFIDRIPYDETRGYVRQVLGNYWNYLRLYSPQIQQQINQIN